MLLCDLLEASIPPTSYGYWIDPLGKILPVGNHGHEQFVRDQGFNSATALRRGWIRVTTIHGFQVEAMFTQVISVAKTKMMQLARASDATAYFVDNHTFEGEYESALYSTFIEFQQAMMEMV